MAAASSVSSASYPLQAIVEKSVEAMQWATLSPGSIHNEGPRINKFGPFIVKSSPARAALTDLAFTSKANADAIEGYLKNKSMAVLSSNLKGSVALANLAADIHEIALYHNNFFNMLLQERMKALNCIF